MSPSPIKSLQEALWLQKAELSVLTWLFHGDFCAARDLLCQLIPGIVGAEQPFLHMAVVAATVTDLGSLDREAK